jgi:metal transporter CNNM
MTGPFANPHRIIGEEIVDETDRYQDNRSHKVAKRAGTAAVMRELPQI